MNKRFADEDNYSTRRTLWNEALFNLTQDIAKHLGDDWKAEKRADYYEPCLLVNKHRLLGIRVLLNETNRSNLRVTFNISYGFGKDNFYNYKPYSVGSPEIHVGAERPAEVIAKEVARRFLPAFKEVNNSVTRVWQSYQKQQAEAQKRVSEYVELLGADRVKLSEDKLSASVRLYLADTVSFTATVSSNGSAHSSGYVSMSADLFKKVVQVITDHIAELEENKVKGANS